VPKNNTCSSTMACNNTHSVGCWQFKLLPWGKFCIILSYRSELSSCTVQKSTGRLRILYRGIVCQLAYTNTNPEVQTHLSTDFNLFLMKLSLNLSTKRDALLVNKLIKFWGQIYVQVCTFHVFSMLNRAWSKLIVSVKFTLSLSKPDLLKPRHPIMISYETKI